MLRRALVLATAISSLTACSDPEVSSGPTPGAEAVTYEMTTSLPAGTEAEHCKFVEAPAEGMLVNRDRITYTAGSHHFLVYLTPYEEIPTEDDQGNPIEYLDPDQGVFDCSEGVQFSYSVQQLVAGSQNADGDSMVDFPPGVAMRVPPKAVLLMNAHYINASTEELSPVVDVAFDTIEEEELEHEGSTLFWFDLFIKAPGQGQGYSTTRCDLPEDVTLLNAQSHMHARGVDYEAVLIDPAGDRESFYTNTEWEDVPVKSFDGGLPIEGGSRIEYTCHYDNPGQEDIFMGPRSTDEMCMFIGSYYPNRPEVDLCAQQADAPYDTQWFGAEWVGQGETSCSESLTCFQAALSADSDEPFAVLQGVTECVIASDPAVAPELSDAIGCTFATFLTGGNPLADCQPQFAECSAK